MTNPPTASAHKPAPVVISGSIAIDRIMSFGGRYQDYIRPEQLDKLSISIFLNALQDSHGGVGANIAYTMALLGDEPILLGSVGPNAHDYMAKLRKLGVQMAHIHQSKLPTASFNVISDADENQVGGFYPGAMFDSDNLGLAPWRETEAIVVVSPHDPVAMRRQVAECRSWGLRLCYDVGQQVSNLGAEDLAEGVDAAHVLIVNEYEMGALAAKLGRTVAEIKAEVPVVVTTLGREGSVVEGRDIAKPLRVGVAAPKAAVDPTGAGDAYRAGFLYGWSRGWEWRECAQLGAVCGAYAVEQAGTQEHWFTREAAATRYREAFGKNLPA